nr:hypothetical protein [uncultured Anaerobutyricum sp.]
MKTLYIHIGCPKTGTTSLQYFCKENSDTLAEHGIYFPVFPQRYPGVGHFRNAHFLFGHQYNSDGQIDFLEEKRIFRLNMDHIIYKFSKYDNILISDEGLWYAAHYNKKYLWETLQKEALTNSFKIKIIVYLRRQDALLNSIWNQKIKEAKQRYRSMTWDKFTNLSVPAAYLNYDEGLSEIADYFGFKNIIVRRYGKRYFKNGSIYDDFLDTLGLTLTDDYTISTFERNLGLSGNAREIQRILNTIPDASQSELSYFKRLLANVSLENPDSEKLSMFSPKEAETFMEKYREGNRKVMEKYFHKSEDLFKINFENTKKWEWDAQAMSEDIILLIANSTLSLKKENEELRQQIHNLEETAKQQNTAMIDLKNKLKHPLRTLLTRILKKKRA